MRTTLLFTALAAPLLLLAGACSEATQDDAELAAERAAADAEANAEVIGNDLREGAIIAADGIADGAEALSEDLSERGANDPDPGDGDLDGTD